MTEPKVHRINKGVAILLVIGAAILAAGVLFSIPYAPPFGGLLIAIAVVSKIVHYVLMEEHD